MAHQTNSQHGSKKTQFLSFHPHAPTFPSIKPKKIEKFHPYKSSVSHSTKPSPLISTNIKGMLFHPHQCLTSSPKQSIDDTNWQINWIEQFDKYKKECHDKEEQLKKVVAHKDAEIGEQKSLCKTQSELLKQKTDEIDKCKLNCKAKNIIVKQNLVEIERLQLELKVKSEIAVQKAAETEQYKLKCVAMDEVVKHLRFELKAKDESVGQKIAEAEFLKLKCEALAEIEKQKTVEIELLQLEIKAKEVIVDQKTAETEQYKSKCEALAELVKQSLHKYHPP